MKPSGTFRYWGTVAILAAFYFVVGKVGLMLAFARPSVTAVWPPSGIAVAALLIFGYRVWPGILLGALAVELTSHAGVGTALGVSFSNGLESLFGAWLANRFARGRRFFERPQDVLVFAVLVGMLSPLISPPLGASRFSPGEFIFWPVLRTSRLNWWMGDMVSIVLLAPLVLVWAAQPRFRRKPREVLEFSILLVLLVLVCGAVFGDWAPAWAQGYLFPYLCLPFLFWAAFRFDQRETMTATFVLGIVVMWSTLRGNGLFSRVVPGKDLLVYQSFMAITSVLALALTSVTFQRRRSREELERAHDELEIRVQQRTEALRIEVEERKRVEAALARSRAELAAMFDAMSDAVVFADSRRHIALINPSFTKIFGYTADEVKGRSTDLLYSDRRVFEEMGRRRFGAGEFIETGVYEVQYRRKDGSVFWSESASAPVRDAQGQIAGFVSVHRDITERKAREAEVRKFNRTLTALTHSSQAMVHAEEEKAYLDEICRIIVEDCGHEMVWIGFAEQDEARTVRPAAHAGLEMGYLETLRITWSDTERGRGPTGSAIRTGQVYLCRDILADPRLEPWRDEATRRGYASSIALPLRTNGRIFGALTIYSREPAHFTDDEVRLLNELAGDLAYGISSLRLRAAHARAEQALRQQEVYYRTLAENLPGLVYRVSLGRQPGMQFFNDLIEPMTGYASAELSFGQVCSLDPCIVEEDHGFVTAAVTRSIENHEPFAIEYRFKHKNGGIRYFAERGRPIYGPDGRPTHIDGVIFDVTDRKLSEAALRESQARLRQLAENIREVFWLGSPDWNEIYYISPAYEEVWGRSCASLYQSPRSWMESVLAEDGPVAGKAVEDGVDGNLGKVFPTYRIRRPDGTVRWIHARAWPIRDDQGRIYRVAGIAEDITERKRAEEEREGLVRELVVEKARWQATVESMPEPVTVCDDEGRATFMNAAYQSLLGRPIEPGTTMDRHAIEYQLYHTDGTLFDPRELPLQKAALSGETVRNIELIQRSRDGLEHICVWNAAPLRDAAGRLTGAVAVGRDITAQRRAERALRRINEELELRVVERTAELRASYHYARGLLESSLDPLVTISHEGKITDVNKATEEITGVPRERLIGSRFPDYFTDPERAEAGYQAVIAHGLVRDYPLTIRHATGRSAEVLYNATLYRNQFGEVQGVFAAARDITERKRLEEAHAELLRRLAKAQETERGRISRELHDRLGQDLTALKLGLQLLRKQGPAAASVLHSIGRLEQMADGLVRDIHRLAWELRPAALDDLGLEAALRKYISEWTERSGVQVDFHSQGIESNRLPLDLETTLYRVTQEALTNVVRHARARRVSILLERRREHVSLIVEDDGMGFDADAVIESPGAAGKLGLLGMQERVTLAGGSIQIESTPGAGTTLFVRIPPGQSRRTKVEGHEEAESPGR